MLLYGPCCCGLQPVDPDDPDTSIPIIGAVDARPAAIITANDAVRKASNKAVQVDQLCILMHLPSAFYSSSSGCKAETRFLTTRSVQVIVYCI